MSEFSVSSLELLNSFFAALISEENFPLTLDQLNNLIRNPAEFAGLAAEQSRVVNKAVSVKIRGKISKVELTDLR